MAELPQGAEARRLLREVERLLTELQDTVSQINADDGRDAAALHAGHRRLTEALAELLSRLEALLPPERPPAR
jgi:phage host-nuclease inhibitor protein Gam